MCFTLFNYHILISYEISNFLYEQIAFTKVPISDPLMTGDLQRPWFRGFRLTVSHTGGLRIHFSSPPLLPVTLQEIQVLPPLLPPSLPPPSLFLLLL